MGNAYIVGAVRTPGGKKDGKLKKTSWEEALSIIANQIKKLKKEEKDKNKDFSDPEVMQVLKKAIKRNQDAFEQFSKAGRNDLAEKEQMEIKIISRYLPDELSSSEIEKLVQGIISEVNAKDQKDIGKVMAIIKQNHADSVDMGLASKLVKTILSAD